MHGLFSSRLPRYTPVFLAIRDHPRATNDKATRMLRNVKKTVQFLYFDEMNLVIR